MVCELTFSSNFCSFLVSYRKLFKALFVICVFIILTNLKTTMYFTNLNHTNTLNGIIKFNIMNPIRRSEMVTKKPHKMQTIKMLRTKPFHSEYYCSEHPMAAARMGNHLQVPKTKKFWKPN